MIKSGKIKLAGTERLPKFPPLTDGKKGRVMTKHFCNLPLILNPNHYTLLSFLVYQSDYRNVVKYSNRLLKMYENAIKFAGKTYNTDNHHLHHSPPKTRLYFKWLITEGYLLPVKGKEFLINPNLTYNRLYVVPADYEFWVEQYQVAGKNNNLANNYIEIVEKNYKQKHK